MGIYWQRVNVMRRLHKWDKESNLVSIYAPLGIQVKRSAHERRRSTIDSNCHFFPNF